MNTLNLIWIQTFFSRRISLQKAHFKIKFFCSKFPFSHEKKTPPRLRGRLSLWCRGRSPDSRQCPLFGHWPSQEPVPLSWGGGAYDEIINQNDDQNRRPHRWPWFRMKYWDDQNRRTLITVAGGSWGIQLRDALLEEVVLEHVARSPAPEGGDFFRNFI